MLAYNKPKCGYLAEYNIWSVLREKVYRSKIADINKLKTRLIDE